MKLALARISILSLGFLGAILAFARDILCKFLPSRFVAPKPGHNQVSAAWFEKILKEKNLLESSNGLSSLELCGLDGNRGLAGSMNMLKAKFNKPCNLQNNYILKRNRSSILTRALIISNGGTREATFLSSKYAKCVASAIPTVYYAQSSTLTGEISIVMEDLRESGGINANFICGNQVWGIPPQKSEYISQKNLTAVQLLEKAYLSTAKMHVEYWNNKALLQEKWLKGALWYQGKNQISWELAIERGRICWKQIKVAMKEKKLTFTFSEKLEKIIDLSYEKASWENLQAHLKDPKIPFTLCHGDFHAANMYLRENGDVVMFDWSEVGPWEPTTDLAQMVISDIKPEIFIQHSKTLVKKYWDFLVANGVSATDYPFELCWKRFCHGGAERWIWVFSLLYQYVPGHALEYFHNQLLLFIENHDEQPYYVLKPVVCLM